MPEPQSTQQHRQQTFWQIIFPLCISALILLIVAGLITRSSAAQASLSAQIALIWLLIPLMLFCLVGLILTIFLIILLIKLIAIIPEYAHLVQINVTKVANRIHQIADWFLEPILRIHSFIAMLNRLSQKRQPKPIIRQLYGGGKYGTK
ncbi:MAG: hypothetical protein ACPL6F_02710 [Anaerolineales bacterium]